MLFVCRFTLRDCHEHSNFEVASVWCDKRLKEKMVAGEAWWWTMYGKVLQDFSIKVLRGEFADTITEESNDSSRSKYTGTFNYTSFYFRAKQKKKALYP